MEGLSFKDMTSFKVGGKIKNVFYPRTIEDIIYFVKNNSDYLVVGNGTNILASDKEYNGNVIKFDKMNKFKNNHLNLFTFSSNVTGAEIASFVKDKDYSGAEFLATIPGSLGGMVAMNAGCYKQEIADYFYKGVFIDSDGRIQILTKRDMEFGYRNSICNKEKLICVYVILEFKEGPFDHEKLKRLMTHRKDTQPIGNSAGSVFVNPNTGLSAWQLIDSIGLRGTKFGGAVISDKHCNFILNVENSTSQDIYNLIQYVKENVFDEYAIDLKTEIKLINF